MHSSDDLALRAHTTVVRNCNTGWGICGIMPNYAADVELCFDSAFSINYAFPGGAASGAQPKA